MAEIPGTPPLIDTHCHLDLRQFDADREQVIERAMASGVRVFINPAIDLDSCRRVLALAWEKQSESNAMWALSLPVPFTAPVGAGAGGYFAPHVRSYIRETGAPEHVGAMVAVKDRLNGSINPYAHLKQPDITVDKVLQGQMLWDPIRFDETCPSSDGACAIVIGDSEAAETVEASGRQVAWIHATALRTEPGTFAGRDYANPQASRDAAASNASTSPAFHACSSAEYAARASPAAPSASSPMLSIVSHAANRSSASGISRIT